MMDRLAAEAAVSKTVMLDATYLKAHRTATSLRATKGGPLIGRTKGGLSTKLHAVADNDRRPIPLLITAGQVSDDTGAAALLGSLPKEEWLPADRGHYADWYRRCFARQGDPQRWEAQLQNLGDSV